MVLNFATLSALLPLLGKLVPSVPVLSNLFTVVPTIIARGFSLNAIEQDLEDPDIIAFFRSVGGQLFPAVGSAPLQTAAGAATFAPDYVVKIQKLLNQVDNAGLTEDGQYGPMTRAAVKKYQTRKGLTPDSFAGDLTRAALQADAQPPATPAAVDPAPKK